MITHFMCILRYEKMFLSPTAQLIRLTDIYKQNIFNKKYYHYSTNNTGNISRKILLNQ
ncbi:hypothetical protein AFERRI_530253 [Acidithiobacillus ferrivorans]|uniref:Uncharacterized protein n=1 Tax=Acidithiobacillus ferrivorans TaxID=160808 RepID=A0A060UX92_9PROT|nr:hypothetical protein AFERRI_530253 [Acidithiobacillus ferrivorans]